MPIHAENRLQISWILLFCNRLFAGVTETDSISARAIVIIGVVRDEWVPGQDGLKE
jgi:hypothetical protein